MIKSDKPFDYSAEKYMGIGDKFPKKIHNATSTSDGLMSSEDKAKLDTIDLVNYNRVYDVASRDSDGLLSKEDKVKLDNIENNANNYVHPNNENIRHVTDTQIVYWNDKASTQVSTTEINGLMSATDKIKLDGIAENATRYFHPNTHPATMIVEDSTHRFVTDTEKEYWNDKASKDIATAYYDGLMSADDKSKLNNIENNANNYVHPNNEGIRHVTDAEKSYWNAKANKSIATNSENGLMPYQDKIKLDGIENNANNYVHPNTSEIRHVTDSQISYWNNKAESKLVTQTSVGLMSVEDKVKLDNIENNANNYVHPNTSEIRHVTDDEKEYWNDKANKDIVTNSENGLMSATDKSKLDGIENNANNYVHPNTHSASMIVEDSTHRFVTDTQITNWNNGASYTNSTPTLNSFGGIPAGTVFDNVPITTIITRLLYPYISPEVSISIDPNGGIYEKGISVNINKILVNITKKSEDISKVEILDGSNILTTRTDGQTGQLEFLFDNLSINSDKKITVSVTDTTGNAVVKQTNSFNFVYPYFQGIINLNSSINSTTINGLSKLIQTKGNKTISYDINNQKMVFAYPKEYGLLSKITDPNQFDITDTFDIEEVQYVSMNNIAVPYYVYISNALTVTDYTIKFNY